MDTHTPGTPGRQWEPSTVNRRRTQKMLEKFGRKPCGGDTAAKVGTLRCGGLRARERSERTAWWRAAHGAEGCGRAQPRPRAPVPTPRGHLARGVGLGAGTGIHGAVAF